MPDLDADAIDALYRDCRERLSRHALDARRDPVATAVRRLQLDLLERRDSGALTRADLSALGAAVGAGLLAARARRLAAKAPAAGAPLLATLASASFDDAKRLLERERVGIVFTAHPTFALSRAHRRAIGRLADGETVEIAQPAANASVTLAEEHADALAAIERAQDAAARIVAAWGETLSDRWPARWTEIAPTPVTIATWVGYDLDGRTDIAWTETFRIRLSEKARQLARYAATLDGCGAEAADLADRLRRAAALAERQAAAFAEGPDCPAAVVEAANLLTTDHADRLVSMKPAIAEVGELLRRSTDVPAQTVLFALRSEMAVCGLGVARVHLRVNAAQVRSAVRADLGLDIDSEFLDRTALDAAAAKARAAEPHQINFGSIFLEQMTARRQLMLAAQIVKHVDADQPIRFLIAEIEAPATVMSALYLARLYGVDGAVDISPLFETPEALDRAGRFLERLLDEEAYVAEIRRRGRIAIQLGFSDSGRFMGQIAADMAIERVHILLSRALARRDIRDVEATIFNTHGESMGRGGHPGGFAARLDHLMTPWARARFAYDGIATTIETSFQGGDGYLHFETPQRADAVLRAVCRWAFETPAADRSDAFYADINFSWDVFRAVKTWQEALFADPHYQSVLSAVGVSLLPPSGSRKTRRQSGASATDLARALRAIPNNAILQTLAAPANVWGGIGTIAAREPERFRHLVEESPRMQGLVAMAAAARRLTSLSVLRTYATLYSPGFWIVAAARAGDGPLADRATVIGERLAARALDVDFDRLANLLSVDRRHFDAAGLGGDANSDDAFDPDLYLLHALRMTFMVEGFRLVAATPTFSPRHEATRDGLVDLALELRFAEVADLVDEIFPESAAAPAAFDGLAERADAAAAPAGYPEMRRDISDPLRALDRAIKEIAVALSHAYDAFG